MDACKVLIDSSVNICCAPHAILFHYNLLEPKKWEDGPIEVTLPNEKKTLSCYYVELGRNLLRVALVSEIRNVILSIKQTNERGMEVRFTSVFCVPEGERFILVCFQKLMKKHQKINVIYIF